MKKISFLLVLSFVLFMLNICIVNASQINDEMVDNINFLVNSYYNDGVYTKDTKIYLKEEAVNELVEKNGFHAGSDILERTTYFIKDALWMSHGNQDTKYSYYGTAGSDMTGGVVDNVGDVTQQIAYKGKTMEEYYITMNDVVLKAEHNWEFVDGKYLSTSEEVIDWFKAITAPCFLGFVENTQNYISLSSVSVEEIDDKLVLCLYASSIDESKLTSGSTLFSEAVITAKEYSEFSLKTVLGNEVKDNKVVLSASQYDLLLKTNDLISCCDFDVQNGVSVDINLNDKTLDVVTSIGGNYSYEVVVLSNETDFSFNNSEKVNVSGEQLICEESLIKSLENNSEIALLLDYSVSEGASVSMSYDTSTMVLSVLVISEDNEVVSEYIWEICMEQRFFAQDSLGIGTDGTVLWNAESDCYLMGYSDETVRAAYYYNDTPVGGLYYTFKTNVSLINAIQNGEFVVENVETGGSRLRFVIRYDGSRFIAFTDYLSYNVGFKAYRELAYFDDVNATIEIVRFDNWFIFLLNDIVVWKQEMTFGATQIIVGGEKIENHLKNITSTIDKEIVTARYDEIKDDFEPLSTYVNNYNYSESNHVVFDENNGVLMHSPKNAAVYSTYYYQNGTPLVGQYYTFEGTFNIGSHNGKVHPGVGLRILGSNNKVLRVYLRINTNWSNKNEHQITIDNGSGSESAGTQVRIRYYQSSVKIKAVMNGKYTTIYVNDVMVFHSDGTSSQIAKNPEGSEYSTSTKILGVTGHRHLGFVSCGASVSISNITATNYPRILSSYESTIQKYVDEYLANPRTEDIVYAGSSFMEYWNTKHNFAETMEGVNVGLAGSHSSDWLQLIDRLITPYQPKKIILYLGGNDASKQGNDMAPFVAESVIRMINEMHSKTSAYVYWLSLLSFTALNDYNDKAMNEINRIVKEYLDDCEYASYVDIASVITPNGVAVEEYFAGSDGVHMNSAGYAKVEEILKEYFNE